MKKLLPVLLTFFYVVHSKYLLVQTEELHQTSNDEDADDYRGGDYYNDNEIQDSEADDYNIFLRKVSKVRIVNFHSIKRNSFFCTCYGPIKSWI